MLLGNSYNIDLLGNSCEICFQLLITYIQYMPNLVIGQILPHRRLDLNDTKSFSMAEHLHIFKTLERHIQD